jgi:hypothetical protein
MTENTIQITKEIDNEIDKTKFYLAPTNGLIKMFEKIARGWGRKFPQTNQQDLDSYVAFAVSEAWRKWKKYNPTVSGNLFAFFTSVISNDMALAHNKLNKNKHLHIPIDGLFVNQSQL